MFYTSAGGEGGVANNGAADAESPANIVSKSASAAAVVAAVPGAAAAVAVTGFGWSPTRPQAQAPPGKVTGYSALAWHVINVISKFQVM